MKFVFANPKFLFWAFFKSKTLLICTKISLKSKKFQGFATLNSIISGNCNESFLVLHYWAMAWKLTKNGLRIFYDDFSEKVKNIHDEMEKHYSYKKACISKVNRVWNF